MSSRSTARRSRSRSPSRRRDSDRHDDRHRTDSKHADRNAPDRHAADRHDRHDRHDKHGHDRSRDERRGRSEERRDHKPRVESSTISTSSHSRADVHSESRSADHRSVDEDAEYQRRVEQQLLEAEDDEAAEARRAAERRERLKKLMALAPPAPIIAPVPVVTSTVSVPVAPVSIPAPTPSPPPAAVPAVAAANDDDEFMPELEISTMESGADQSQADAQTSAAAEQQDSDRRDEERRLAMLTRAMAPDAGHAPASTADNHAAGKPQSAKMFDMFGDDDIESATAAEPVAVVSRGGEAHDNWDDSDGYYHFRPGDVLNGQYQVFANQGRGVFSSVVRVRDLKAKPPVGGAREPEFVVKVIRNNEVMYKAGLREVEFLQLLEKNDPDHRRHCIHLVAHFEHRGHLCLVFEAFAFNLREIIKKYGAGLGLHISAVRSYAQQLVIALKLTKKCGLLHADLKPDNILISEDNRTLKLCDFGSATATNDVEITPYLVARFYRAPEIMLGLPYDCAADMWSVGCTLYEMYTGKVLFAGKDNNEMLRMQQEARGAIPKRLLRRATFRDQHFDEASGLFEARLIDRVTGQPITRLLTFDGDEAGSASGTRTQSRDLGRELARASGQMSDAEARKLQQLRDLIEQCLLIDPARRITPEDALKHPFIHDTV